MPKKDEVTTKFKVDISDLKKGISEANQQIKLANAQFKAASAGMDDWTKSAEGIKAKLSQLDSILDAQKSKLSAYKEQLQRTEEAYRKNGEKAAELRSKLQELSDKGVSKTSAEYQKYERELASVEKEQAANKTSADKLKVTILEQEAAVKKTEKEYSTYEKTLDDVGKEQTEDKKSAKELTDATAESGKAADKAKDGFTVLKGVLANLAAEGVKMAVQGLKNLASSFSETIQSVADAGDAIEKSSQKVGLSFESYQQWDYAMKIAGTEMANMETGLKTLTKTFDSAKQGTKSSIETFERLGLSMSDIKDLSREELFGTIIEQLQGITDDTTKAALASKIFGKSGQDLLPLLNQSADATKELLQQAKDYGMVLSDDAVSSSAAFKDSLTLLQGALTGTKNRIVSEFLPATTELMKGFAGVVAGVEGADETLESGATNFISEFTEMIPKAVQVFTTFAKSIITVLPDILKQVAPALIQAIPALAGAITEVLPSLLDVISSTLIESIPELISITGQIITSILQSLTEYAPLLIEQIFAILPEIINVLMQVVPELIKSAFVLYATIVKSYLTTGLNFIKSVLSQVGQWIYDNVITPVIDYFRGLWKTVSQFFSDLWEDIKAIWNKVATWFNKNVIQPVVGFFKDLWDGIVKAYHTVIDPWIEIVRRAFAKWKEKIIDPVLQFFSKLWNSIKEAGQKAFDKIQEIWGVLSGWFKEHIIQPVSDFFGKMWNGLKDGASKAWEGIKNVFSPVVEWFRSKFSEAWQKVKDVFSTGGKIFDGIKDGIANAFKVVVNALIRGINKVIAVPFNAINSMFDKLRAISILGVSPFSWIRNFGVPQIPELARGGVLKRGQMALLEGNGAEAVVPLENNKRWISAVAADMAKALKSESVANAFSTTTNNETTNFTQNIYSPKAPSRIELYRQTRNLLALKEGV